MTEEGELKKRIFEVLGKYRTYISSSTPYPPGKEIDMVMDEAKKDINIGIRDQLNTLIIFWEKTKKSEHQEVKQYYVDAYKCILHNHIEHDSFKIKKWFGDSEWPKPTT